MILVSYTGKESFSGADLMLRSHKIIEDLNKKYSTQDFYDIKRKLMRILRLGEVKGKSILDLGCGSVNSRDECEPYFSRALHEMGAKVIGIDLYDLSKEKFKGYNVDLSMPNSLDFLKDNSVDIACADAFFDSPTLRRVISGEEVFKILIPQLERIVKPEGHSIFEKTCSGYVG